MIEQIKNYQEHLRICGWRRISQNIWTDDGIFMFNVYDNFDYFNDYIEVIKNSDYIYCLELEQNCIKIGYSSNLKKRISTHFSDNKSIFKDKIKRIAILGPIEDGKKTEQIIHSYLSKYNDDIYTSTETYFFNDELNSFDTFMIMFQFFQSSLILGEVDHFEKMELIKVKQ